MHAQRGIPRRRGRRPGRGIALALSVALHVGVLGALALRFDGASPAAAARGFLVRLILPPGTLVAAPDGDGPLPPQTAGAGSRVFPAGCRGAIYTGIGVRINVAGFI